MLWYLRTRWRRCIFGGALGLLLLGLLASWVVGGLLVAPQLRQIGDPPDDLPAESVAIPSESGSTLAGWHVRSETQQGVVILLHGIGDSRRSMVKRAHFLRRAGYSLLMCDFQAHGESFGEQISLGHLERFDVRAMVRFAERQHPGEPIGVIGCSLGGAAALLAGPLPIDALVLEGVFPTISDAIDNRVRERLGPLATIGTQLLLLQFPARQGIRPSALRPIDHLPDVEGAVFLMSGLRDVHTTPAETRAMFAVSKQPKQLWFIKGAGHQDLHRAAGEEYERRVLDFFSVHLNRPVAAEQSE